MIDRYEIMVSTGKRLTEYDATAPRGRLAPPVAALSIGGQAPMAYIKATKAGNWRSGGESATAECQQVDECEWEIMGYVNLREATRLAEDHVIQTGHTVEVERAQFRYISPVR